MLKKNIYTGLKVFTIFLFLIPLVSASVGTGDAIVYAMSILILLALLIGCIVIVSKSKVIWLKLLCGGLAYLFLMIISYITWVTSIAMTETAFIDKFFYWIFMILTIALFPLLLGSLAYYIYKVITVKPIMDMMKRGVPEDRAYASQISRDMKRSGRGLI